MTTKISLDCFDGDSIDDAIKALEAYKDRVSNKTQDVVTSFFEEFQSQMDRNMEDIETLDDDLPVTGNYELNNLVFNPDGYSTTASFDWVGEEVTFIEFGTGVTLNGPAGQSPHPLGNKLGMTIGEYGNRLGANRNGWHYRGKVHFGLAATMPTYFTATYLRQHSNDIVKGVFSK